MYSYAHVFKGTAFTSQSSKEISVFKDYLYCINTDGFIEDLVSPEDENYQTLIDYYYTCNKLIELNESQYLLPGFIDLHIHAPQWAQAGCALDTPLNDWLHTYTFPLEAKFTDLTFAEKVYQDLINTLLANGTTTALYFATIHKESSLLLAEICAKSGQRGLVGKVVMDNIEQTPEYYRDTHVQTALNDTEEFILAVKQLSKSVKQGVYPVVTPRFIPSCSDEVLKGLGELAAKYDVHIQSHCSESDWEHNFVKERFNKHDAAALYEFGLLREKSIMAHCNFIDDADAELFKATGTAIAHCPISNAYFANSVLPLNYLHSKGLEIGLASDISGGYSPSVKDNLKQAVISSRMLEEGVNPSLNIQDRGTPQSRISLNEAFYFATVGGGESLGLPIGRISRGYAWDVQIIDTTTLPIFDENEHLLEIFQKIIYLTTAEHIKEVWIQGNKVHSKK